MIRLVLGVIFPLIARTEQELNELKTNGLEYTEFIADIIDDKVI